MSDECACGRWYDIARPEMPPVGMRVQFEASVNGSRFIGRVRRHITYAGRPALEVEREPGGGKSIVYPEQLIRQPDLNAR